MFTAQVKFVTGYTDLVKICILSEKCFELYAISVATVISNNIWVPISNTSPEERIYEIVELLRQKYRR